MKKYKSSWFHLKKKECHVSRSVAATTVMVLLSRTDDESDC